VLPERLFKDVVLPPLLLAFCFSEVEVFLQSAFASFGMGSSARVRASMIILSLLQGAMFGVSWFSCLSCLSFAFATLMKTFQNPVARSLLQSTMFLANSRPPMLASIAVATIAFLTYAVSSFLGRLLFDRCFRSAPTSPSLSAPRLAG